MNNTIAHEKVSGSMRSSHYQLYARWFNKKQPLYLQTNGCARRVLELLVATPRESSGNWGASSSLRIKINTRESATNKSAKFKRKKYLFVRLCGAGRWPWRPISGWTGHTQSVISAAHSSARRMREKVRISRQIPRGNSRLFVTFDDLLTLALNFWIHE